MGIDLYVCDVCGDPVSHSDNMRTCRINENHEMCVECLCTICTDYEGDLKRVVKILKRCEDEIKYFTPLEQLKKRRNNLLLLCDDLSSKIKNKEQKPRNQYDGYSSLEEQLDDESN